MPNNPNQRSLHEWLEWQQTLHPQAIDLGIERIRPIYRRLFPHRVADTIISVAGTNGKGSSIALLESIYRNSGYRVGTFTSPHLCRYNERMRIDAKEASDLTIASAFTAIDAVRNGVTLTYFEFSTLAALWIMSKEEVDIALLEVGMGGRLDAVNLVDADLALITTIDLDHTAWLGNTKERIAIEKAGIMRQGALAVCSDPDVPQSLIHHADKIGAKLFLAEREFFLQSHGSTWNLALEDREWFELPQPYQQGDPFLQNCAGVLTAIALLGTRLKVSDEVLKQGLREYRVPGRFQSLDLKSDTVAEVIVDVAHNPQSTRQLAKNLRANEVKGKRVALCALLADKAIMETLDPFVGMFTQWGVISQSDELRGDDGTALITHIHGDLNAQGIRFDKFTDAWKWACREASTEQDQIVVFGSFHLVGKVMALAC